MRKMSWILGIFLLILALPTASDTVQPGKKQVTSELFTAAAPPAVSAPPVYFIENLGQVEKRFDFHLKLPRGNAFFATDRIIYQFIGGAGGGETNVENLSIRLSGSDSKGSLSGDKPGKAHFNFYRGSDPREWIEGAKSYRRLLYKEVYPRIDLAVEWKDGSVKHEFYVRPGGRVEDIALHYSGIQGMRVDESGRLEMRTRSRRLVEEAPVSFQVIDGRRVAVESGYRLQESHELGYRVGDYRSDRVLVIDPSLVYSTFLGGSQLDAGSDLVVDTDLNTYVTGTTQSGNFPKTPGAHDRIKVGKETFLCKLDPTGADLLFSTYFGGSGQDSGTGIAFSHIDSSPVIAGRTTSRNLPIRGGYDRNLGGGSDLFVAKFSASGTLTAASYFGGGEDEFSARIAVDGSGFIFLAGITLSPDLPTTAGVVDRVFNASPSPIFSADNLFITKFSKQVSSLRYSTFYGDWEFELGGIVADYYGSAYVAGVAYFGRFPTTPGAYRDSPSMLYDGFLLKLAPDGREVDYATYIGDPYAWDHIWVTGLDVDGDGNAYVIGRTRMEPELIYPGFISKFNSTAGNRPFRYQFSPDSPQYPFFWIVNPLGVAVDGRGGVYVSIATEEASMPTTEGAFQAASNGADDVYLAKLRTGDGSLDYATYLGGAQSDSASGIAADSFGSIYLTGLTQSSDFPTTPGAFDLSYAGEGDAFVARIRDTGASGRLSLNKSLHKFQVPWKSTATRSKSFRVGNAGSGKVSYQVRPSQAWMTTTPASGECRTEKDLIKLTVDPKGLKPGTHSGSVRVYSVDAVNSPQQLQVLFKVKGPAIKLSRKRWTRTVTEGGDNPADLTAKIRNSGPGKLRWRLAPQISWLSVTSAMGHSTGEWDTFKIKIDITGLAAGIHAGTIAVTSPDTVDTETITVTLNVQSASSAQEKR